MKWLLPFVLILLALGTAVSFVKLRDHYFPNSPEKLIDYRSGKPLKLGAFSLTNQNAALISEKYFEGKVVLASFFFSRCTTVCPKLMGSVNSLAVKLKNVSNVEILSITVDPNYDQSEHLKAYADRFKESSTHWEFLTGKQEDVYLLSKNTFSLAAAQASEAEFIHSEKIVLIDAAGILRGYYDSSKQREMDQLYRDTLILVKEARARKLI